MAITKFVPEIWAATLLSVLSKALVYAGAPCVNRDYEGDISEYGDTVHITSVADPTIVDYTKDTDLPDPEALTDDEQLLLIDQSKAFNFAVDDIDLRQTRNGGALMAEAASRAAFGLRDKADTFVAGKMVGSAAAGLGLIDATTVTNVYDELLVPASVALNQANVPTEGRFVVLPPAVYGKLQLDGRFIKVNEAGGSDGLRNGNVGDAAGFRILMSNNAPNPNRTSIHATTTSGSKAIVGAAGTFNQGDVGLTIAGTGVGSTNHVVSVSSDGATATTAVNSSASAAQTDIAISGGSPLVVAGTAIATSYAEQIAKVEAYRPQKRFGDALKGLHLYGGKVVRGQALVVASVKTS